MLSFFQRWRERRIIQRSEISSQQWREAFAALPLLRGYAETERQRLRELAILFLDDKSFSGAQGCVVTPAMQLVIALQACIPLLNLGLRSYHGWQTIIVYPAGFAPRRSVQDEYGVVHDVQSHLAGEAWQRGPLVLSWDDTEHAGVIDGENLVIHEFAHKLDMLNGEANGFPPLHADMSAKRWFEVFSAGFSDFQEKCRRGDQLGINCYAATSPAEFFAVLSEVFFERPELIHQPYAEVYQQLQLYYRQDPLARLKL